MSEMNNIGTNERPIFVERITGYLLTTDPATGDLVQILDANTRKPLTNRLIYVDALTKRFNYIDMKTGKVMEVIDPITDKPMLAEPLEVEAAEAVAVALDEQALAQADAGDDDDLVASGPTRREGEPSLMELMEQMEKEEAAKKATEETVTVKRRDIDMDTLFVKQGDPKTASLEGEAAALRWLAEAESLGGIPVAEVVSASPSELVERRVSTRFPSAAAAERAGAALAITHAAGAPWWGAPPTGWEGAYLIGETTTPTVREVDAPHSWGAFFAEWRIMPYLQQARDAEAITADECAVIEHVATRLLNGDFDAPQPALVVSAGHDVARIHGDLWSGNLLWDADPANHVGIVLIDPMAHGGHAETDLAMLALFGCPFLDNLLAAYNEVSPLADGWRDRVRLHQLAPLLHHCALFGHSYVAKTLQAARPYA